jgi:hypothetical protein
LCEAVTFTCESDVTATVVIGNVTEVCPAGTVTLFGTVRMPQVDSRYTVSATSGAPARVTVPVPDCPPTIVAGSVTEARLGSIVSEAAAVEPPMLTVTTACTGADS